MATKIVDGVRQEISLEEEQELARKNAQWLSEADSRLWRDIRAKRDQLLAESDYTQLADSPKNAAVWATYRQMLRDLPQTYADPNTVVFPEQPQ